MKYVKSHYWLSTDSWTFTTDSDAREHSEPQLSEIVISPQKSSILLTCRLYYQKTVLKYFEYCPYSFFHPQDDGAEEDEDEKEGRSSKGEFLSFSHKCTDFFNW